MIFYRTTKPSLPRVQSLSVLWPVFCFPRDASPPFLFWYFSKCHVIKISKIFGDFVPRDPAFARVFSRRSAILKIVEEKALGTRLLLCVTSPLFLGNMLSAGKYRFALCFGVLSNQYVDRSAYGNFFKFNRENKRFERAKVNSTCFHWFPAAILESITRTPTWLLHTKHSNCILTPFVE